MDKITMFLTPVRVGFVAFGLLSAACAAQTGLPPEPARELAATPTAETRSATPAGGETIETKDKLGAPGRLSLQLRPRFNFADQSNKPNQAEAFNMRTLLGYRFTAGKDLQITGQIVDVSWLDKSHVNKEPGNRRSPYPLVGDPNLTDINLLFIDYTGLPETRVRIGRQAIKFDNERFVGDADVRQMPQVYDAVSVVNKSIADTTLNAAYLWNVRTYFGNRESSHTTLLNARKDFEFWPSVGAYAYFTDNPDLEVVTGFRNNSQRILGARLEGSLRMGGDLSLYYTAEAAQQRAYAGGDARIRANYSRLAVGPTWGSYSLLIGQERLGSNNGLYGFQMPLSYNTFQGWAYEFFNTPRQGVRDRSVSVAAAFGPLNVWLKHHRFDAEFGTRDYGHEWDFAAAYRIRPSLSVRAVLASFRADAGSARPSAERYSLTLQYDY